MPLTELVRNLRVFKGKVDAPQEGASTSTNPTTRLDTDCVELVWENGQIMVQGKARKNPVSNNCQTYNLRPQDDSNDNNCSRITKFGAIDSVMGDFPLPVPSCQMGLDQDVDLVPWLSYPMEESLHNEINDYTSDFLHELSGVSINDHPTENPLAYRERKSSFLGYANGKASSSHDKDNNRGGSSEVPQFVLPFLHNIPRSGISDITTCNNSGNINHVSSRDSMLNPSSLSAFTSLRMHKLDAVQHSTSSGITNFPYFSRPSPFSNADHVTVNPSKGFENDDIRCTVDSSNPTNSTLLNLDSGCSQKDIVSNNQSVIAPSNGNSEALPAKTNEEPLTATQPMSKEDIVNANKNVSLSQHQAYDATMSKLRNNGDKNVEPVVAASSVCSGNSVERASNEPARNSKRKSRETEESDGPSEEVEEESVGARKPVHNRNSSKRSRASEVHNMSERRRRDRINEKMRALQELIPNCNKADKASMLDEAIEYLKTLQLQVQMSQIMSMGAGMYMQPMMLPTGMQPIHGAHMPHFSPMGLGMGLGMGFGMNMFNMNHGSKMAPSQRPHYPVHGTGPSFPGMLGSNLPTFVHPVQGLPMSMQQTPVATAPMSGNNLKMSMGLNASASGVSALPNAPHLAPSSDRKDANSQLMHSMASNNNINSAINQGTNQASKVGNQQSALHRDQTQTQHVNASETSETANTKDMRS